MSKMDMIERAAMQRAGLDAISGLAQLFDNGNPNLEDLASEAIWNDRAAYWTTAPVADGPARGLCQRANAGENTLAAIRSVGFGLMAVAAEDRANLLATLIPLNPKAAAEIKAARGL